eukprot:978418-Prorocentrum_lima.AAC.1
MVTFPKGRDFPICQQALGPVVRHHQFDPLHADLTAPLVTGLRGHRYSLIMVHRLQQGEESILIPWVAPTQSEI